MAELRGIDDRFARRAIWLPVAILGCFFILLICAAPHADDFCFAAMWRDLGVVGMIADLYQELQGRLLAPVLIVIPFMVTHAIGGHVLLAFRVFCAIVLAFIVWEGLWIGQVLALRCSKSIRLLAGLLLGTALVAGSPQPEDMLYWANGIGDYTISAVGLLWAMIWLHLQADRKASLGIVAVALFMLGGALVALTTEISGPILIVIVLASMVRRWLISGAPRQPLAHALILCAIAAAMVVDAMAPGNAVRMHLMGSDHAIALRVMVGVPKAISYFGQFLFRRLTNPAIIVWIGFLVLIVPVCDQRPSSPEPMPRPQLVWLPLVTALIAIYGSIYMGYVATADMLPPRSADELHFILMGGLSLTARLAAPVLGPLIWEKIARVWPSVDGRKLATVGLAFTLVTPHFLQALLTLPHVVDLYRLQESRFAVLGDGGQPIADRELALPALPIVEFGWFSDPVSSDPKAWANDCAARYAGVRSVRIAPAFPPD